MDADTRDETTTDDLPIVIHHAGTATEAVVIRSLLESAGIDSPGSASPDMFPMREPPKGFSDADIVVLQSQAEEARVIIDEYLAQAGSAEADAPADSAPSDPRSA
jgi:hypothetical protein